MLLARENILNKNRSERPFYRRSIRDLIKIIMITENNIKKTFDISKNVRVDFGDIVYSDDPQQIANTRTTEIKNGTKSRIDFIMEDNPDFTRKDAIAKAELIDEETIKTPLSEELTQKEVVIAENKELTV